MTELQICDHCTTEIVRFKGHPIPYSETLCTRCWLRHREQQRLEAAAPIDDIEPEELDTDKEPTTQQLLAEMKNAQSTEDLIAVGKKLNKKHGAVYGEKLLRKLWTYRAETLRPLDDVEEK